MEISFREYQTRAYALALYPNRGDNLIYPTLGLCGESGEIAEKLKKLIRDKGGILSEDDKDALLDELSDVLWYVSALATELDTDLAHIAHRNLVKLESRRDRGVLRGSGDHR